MSNKIEGILAQLVKRKTGGVDFTSLANQCWTKFGGAEGIAEELHQISTNAPDGSQTRFKCLEIVVRLAEKVGQDEGDDGNLDSIDLMAQAKALLASINRPDVPGDSGNTDPEG